MPFRAMGSKNREEERKRRRRKEKAAAQRRLVRTAVREKAKATTPRTPRERPVSRTGARRQQARTIRQERAGMLPQPPVDMEAVIKADPQATAYRNMLDQMTGAKRHEIPSEGGEGNIPNPDYVKIETQYNQRLAALAIESLDKAGRLPKKPAEPRQKGGALATERQEWLRGATPQGEGEPWAVEPGRERTPLDADEERLRLTLARQGFGVGRAQIPTLLRQATELGQGRGIPTAEAAAQLTNLSAGGAFTGVPQAGAQPFLNRGVPGVDPGQLEQLAGLGHWASRDIIAGNIRDEMQSLLAAESAARTPEEREQFRNRRYALIESAPEWASGRQLPPRPGLPPPPAQYEPGPGQGLTSQWGGLIPAGTRGPLYGGVAETGEVQQQAQQAYDAISAAITGAQDEQQLTQIVTQAGPAWRQLRQTNPQLARQLDNEVQMAAAGQTVTRRPTGGYGLGGSF